jgi:hypothetical protein
MKKINLTILFLMLIFSDKLKAQENRWVFLCDYDKGNCNVYYDTISLQKNVNNTTTIWLKYIYNKPDFDNTTRKYFKTALQQYEISCDDRTMRFIAWVYYYVDGSSDSQTNKTSQPESIYPETISERVYYLLCK